MKSTLLVIVWIITLAAGIGMGYLWGNTAMLGEMEPAVLTITSPGETVSQAAATDDQTRAHIEKLERENKAMGQAIFQMTLKEIIGGKNQSPGENYIEECWTAYMQRAERNSGWRNLDNMLNMMMELARYSEEGVRFLDGVINDTRLPNIEREAALQMLAHLPHAAAFNALIDFRDASIMELDYPYDLVMRHIYNLDTEEIAPRIPEMLDQIQYELGTDDFTPERPTVLFYLADKHNSRAAGDLLFDERILQDNVQGALRVAAESHSKIAAEFIGFIAEHHGDVRVRNEAADLLEDW